MFDWLSLRGRLFISYVLLLGVSLVVISAAVLVFIASRPAPTEPAYNRLSAIVQGLNIRDILREFAPNQDSIPDDYQRIVGIMDDFATTRNVRVIWLATVNDRQFVIYDTLNVYSNQARISVFNDEFFSATLEQTLYPLSKQIYGGFNDPDNSMWLYGGITRNFQGTRRNNNALSTTLLVAEPRPTLSLQATLSQFSSSILPPLLQAGAIGILLAFVLAFWMSRSIANPLQTLVKGAEAVAKGNYEQRVPEMGAREIRRLAHAFNEMSQEVRATQNAQRDFLANVSHDLKTPLTSIQGYSQAIMDGATNDPVKAARIIYDEANRMNRLVMELTDLIMMQAGQMTLKPSPINLNELAQALGERLAVVAQKKGVSLDIKSSPVPKIAIDGDRIAQVLTNLLSNAIKFTPTGGKIWLKTQPEKNGVLISVQDTGVGISEKELSRIFERFYQVDKTRGPQRGTGLGLAIAKEIVLAHGGNIKAESKGSQQGTTFFVWLPPHA